MDYPQQTPEELEEVKQVTEEAIAASYENAQNPWKEYALHCVSILAKTMQKFTVDDVRPLVAQSPFKTQDNRALGGVLKEAKRRRWIEASGETRVNKTGHGIGMPVWESRIYGETIDFVKPTVMLVPKVKTPVNLCRHGVPTFVKCPNCE